MTTTVPATISTIEASPMVRSAQVRTLISRSPGTSVSSRETVHRPGRFRLAGLSDRADVDDPVQRPPLTASGDRDHEGAGARTDGWRHGHAPGAGATGGRHLLQVDRRV